MKFQLVVVALLFSFFFQVTPLPNALDTQPFFLVTYIFLSFKNADFAVKRNSALYLISIVSLATFVLLLGGYEYTSGLGVFLKNIAALLNLVLSFTFFRALLLSASYYIAHGDRRKYCTLAKTCLIIVILISLVSSLATVFPPFSSFLQNSIVPNSRSLGDRFISQVSRGSGTGGLYNEPSFATYAYCFACFISYVILNVNRLMPLYGSVNIFLDSAKLSLKYWVSAALLSIPLFLYVSRSGALLAILLIAMSAWLASALFRFIFVLKISKKFLRLIFFFLFSFFIAAIVLQYYGLPVSNNSRAFKLAYELFRERSLDIFVLDRSIFTRTVNLVVGWLTLYKAPFGWGLGGFNAGYQSLLIQGNFLQFPVIISETSSAIPLVFIICIGGWLSLLLLPLLIANGFNGFVGKCLNWLYDPLAIFCLLSLALLPVSPAWPIVGLPLAYLSLTTSAQRVSIKHRADS